MVTTISVSLIAVFLAVISSDSKYKMPQLFKLAFIMVTTLQVIHYDYGSDYMSYYARHFLYTGTIQDFLRLNRLGYGAYSSIGWAVINRLFPGEIGFFLIVALLSIVENYIYYQLIVQNVSRQDQWKCFAIYVFKTTCYVINFSLLRQGLAIALGILSMMMVGKKKPKFAVLLIVLAITIHSSAIVLLPFTLLTVIPLGNGRKYAISISIISLVMFISNTLVGDSFASLVRYVPFIEKQFGVYYESGIESTDSLGLGFVLGMVMFITLIYYVAFRYNELTYELRLFVLLSCIELCIMPFQFKLSSYVSRIQYYFSAFQVVTVPVVYGKIKKQMIRLGISFIYTFLLLFSYYNFFFVTNWSATSYANFHTIFDVLFR